MGNGLHSGTFAMNAGIYDFKFRGVEPIWRMLGTLRSATTSAMVPATIRLPSASNGDHWTFELDLPNGRWRSFTNAAPPGQDGDYNHNGIVDAADYTKWRDNLGSTHGAAERSAWHADRHGSLQHVEGPLRSRHGCNLARSQHATRNSSRDPDTS